MPLPYPWDEILDKEIMGDFQYQKYSVYSKIPTIFAYFFK